MFSLDHNTKQLSNLGHRPSKSTQDNCNYDLEIKNMTPKPYSSTKFNNYIIKDHKRMNVSPQSNLAITPRGTNSSGQHSGKILLVVLILIGINKSFNLFKHIIFPLQIF